MELRDPVMPDEPATPRPSTPAFLDVSGPGMAGDGSATAVTAARWRVDGRLTGMRIGGIVIFALAAVALRYDPLGLGLSLVAAAGLLAYVGRDVVAPVRLAADPEGLTVVTGYGSRTRLAWDEIERVRVDRRRRLGTTAELLEIDAGESLHLFSAYDLGVPPHEAEQTLRGIRAAAGSA